MYPNVFTSQPTAEQVLGAMSLIFWTLTLIMLVTVAWLETKIYLLALTGFLLCK